MKKRGLLTLDTLYPTKRARDLADAIFDTLPLETPIGECIRQWEYHYLAAGGIVRSGGAT